MHSAARPHPHPPFNREEITRAPDEKIDGFGIRESREEAGGRWAALRGSLVRCNPRHLQLRGVPLASRGQECSAWCRNRYPKSETLTRKGDRHDSVSIGRSNASGDDSG